jgi:sulfate permease, SulP family
VRTINLLQNTSQPHLPTLLVGALTIILILTLEKTSLRALGMVVAMIVSPLAAQQLGADAVARVRDIAEIPGSLPLPMLPSPAVFPNLILPALAMTFVGLMQGASITQSLPTPDGLESHRCFLDRLRVCHRSSL